MNVPLLSYISSYLIMSIIFSLYNAITISVLGLHVFKFKLFENLGFELLLLYFLCSNFVFNSLAFLIVAVCAKAETGNSLSYSFLLIAFVFQVFLTDPTAMEFLYIDTPGYEVIKLMRWLFCKYPGFNYVKIWADFVAVSGSHMDIKLARNIQGRQYRFEEDFWAIRKGILPDGKSSLTPGPGYAFIELAMNFLWVMALVCIIEGASIIRATQAYQNLLKLVARFGKEANLNKGEERSSVLKYS